MKITNVAKCLMVCLVLTMASPSMANTGAEIPPTKEVAESRAVQLQNRLVEIEGMDKRTLSRSEKKVLRREVREIKKRARSNQRRRVSEYRSYYSDSASPDPLTLITHNKASRKSGDFLCREACS